MPSRAELELRAAGASVEAASYPNDSNLEQAVLYAEKQQSFTAGTKATATLTASGVFTDGDTVTVGDVTYTFVAALSDTTGLAFEVLIGASAAASLDNFKSAVNGTAGAGTVYGVDTVTHPQVSATTNTDTTQVVESLVSGTASNSIAVSETGSNSAWGASTLLGGTADSGVAPKTVAKISGDANL